MCFPGRHKAGHTLSVTQNYAQRRNCKWEFGGDIARVRQCFAGSPSLRQVDKSSQRTALTTVRLSASISGTAGSSFRDRLVHSRREPGDGHDHAASNAARLCRPCLHRWATIYALDLCARRWVADGANLALLRVGGTLPFSCSRHPDGHAGRLEDYRSGRPHELAC
jgi:hypothetical protein